MSPGARLLPKPAVLLLPRPELLPATMKTKARWMCWEFYLPPNGTKFTKRPIHFATGYGASMKDPNCWCDFETAFLSAQKFAPTRGIGFVMGGGVFGIDLDHCVADGGIAHHVAAEIVSRFQTYTELSPSKSGLHLYALGAFPSGDKKRVLDGQPVECFGDGQFITVTGAHLRSTPLDAEDRRASVVEWHREMFGEFSPLASKPATLAAPAVSDEMANMLEVHAGQGNENVPSHDEDDKQLIREILRSGQGAKFKRLFLDHDLSTDYPDVHSKRGFDHSQADMGLLGILTYWSEDPGQMDRIFRASILHDCKCLSPSGENRPAKWKRLGKRQIEKAIRDRNTEVQGVNK